MSPSSMTKQAPPARSSARREPRRLQFGHAQKTPFDRLTTSPKHYACPPAPSRDERSAGCRARRRHSRARSHPSSRPAHLARAHGDPERPNWNQTATPQRPRRGQLPARRSHACDSYRGKALSRCRRRGRLVRRQLDRERGDAEATTPVVCDNADRRLSVALFLGCGMRDDAPGDFRVLATH